MTPLTTGADLRRARTTLGLARQALAERLGKTPLTLSRYESAPALDPMVALAVECLLRRAAAPESPLGAGVSTVLGLYQDTSRAVATLYRRAKEAEERAARAEAALSAARSPSTYTRTTPEELAERRAAVQVLKPQIVARMRRKVQLDEAYATLQSVPDFETGLRALVQRYGSSAADLPSHVREYVKSMIAEYAVRPPTEADAGL
ncbi:MAG: helix-turn-helix transcriptional regulator [Patescibacteria group bacterium]|nr:helix-turn-helix transcriptional regulator [Patescibacteria group bacterium]